MITVAITAALYLTACYWALLAVVWVIGRLSQWKFDRDHAKLRQRWIEEGKL